VFGSFNDLRSFFGWLAKDAGRADTIMAGMRMKQPGMADVAVLTPLQLKNLFAACKGEGIIALRDKAILWMLFETGLRRSELSGLMMSDVTVKEGSAYVRRGKGGKPRITIFGPSSADALRRYIRTTKAVRLKHWGEADSPLFLSRYGTRLGYSGFGVLITKRGNQAGIDHLHPHMMRHAWRHYAEEAGLNDTEICTLAGWTTTRQLFRYGRHRAVERAVTAARANPVGAVLRRR
jgi:site-specific recombinase XerD